MIDPANNYRAKIPASGPKSPSPTGDIQVSEQKVFNPSAPIGINTNHQAGLLRSQTNGWTVNLADLFTGSFRKENDTYSYIMDDGLLSKAVQLSEAEYNHVLANLKLFQNNFKDCQAKITMMTARSLVNPVMMALSKSFLNLQGVVLSKGEEFDKRRGTFAAIIARLTDKVDKPRSQSKSCSARPFAIRGPEIESRIEKLSGEYSGTPKAPDFRVITAYDMNKLQDYYGPSIIVLPDVHFGNNSAEQLQVERLHKGHEITYRALKDSGLISGILTEGVRAGNLIVVNEGMTTYNRIAIEAGHIDLFMEHAIESFLHNRIANAHNGNYDNHDVAAKRVIHNLNNLCALEPPDPNLPEKIDRSIKSFIQFLGLTNSCDFENTQYGFEIPKFRTDTSKDTLRIATRILGLFKEAYTTWRNRAITEIVKQQDGDCSLVIGAHHVPGMVVDAMTDKNQLPIIIVINNTDLESMTKVEELMQDFKRVKATQEHYRGSLGLTLAEMELDSRFSQE